MCLHQRFSDGNSRPGPFLGMGPGDRIAPSEALDGIGGGTLSGANLRMLEDEGVGM